MAPSLKLTYFPIAGAAEKVRLAFALGGVAFEDNRVAGEAWGQLKPTTPYGQLPLLEIDGKTITQSDAMLRYAGVLAPAINPVATALECDEVLGLVGDFTRSWQPNLYIGMNPKIYGYAEDFKGTDAHAAKVKEMRETWVAGGDIGRFMGYFSAKIEANGGNFVLGAAPTIADCFLVPTLRSFQAGHIDHVPTSCLDEYKVITDYIARFLAVPAIAAWYESKK